MDIDYKNITEIDLSKKINYPFKLLNSHGEPFIVKNNTESDLYIPIEFGNGRECEFTKEFNKLNEKYIEESDIDFIKFCTNKQKLTFNHNPFDALLLDKPELYHQYDVIENNVNCNQTIPAKYSIPNSIIQKEEILDNFTDIYDKLNLNIEESNENCSFDDFINVIKQNYNDIDFDTNVDKDDIFSTIPTDFIENINYLLNYHDKKLKLQTIKNETTPFHIIINENDVVNEFDSIKNTIPIKYDFELDSFQKQAIYFISKNQNVLVAAHTSAGKTAVAEYAIACAERDGKKTIYTSPIKALSNQKFYDFNKKFKDIGIVTGDVQIKENAQTVIMTTEILRSMLYRDTSSRLNDVTYVIFDEAHYLNDEERGVVWEEILIMLPTHIKLVLLSATIPNCHEVAEWIGRVRKQNINVIITYKRPVPLQHILYHGRSHNTKDDALVVIDTDGNFNEINFKYIHEFVDKISDGFSRRYLANKNHYFALVEHLNEQKRLPCIIFIFSIKLCYQTAEYMSSYCFTTKNEEFKIKIFFDKCLARVSQKDRELPQISWHRELCMRGIGVHHSGVLPIIREITELLFKREFIKVLIATETFAIGVNMPAKSVVFSSLSKFTGQGRRNLLSSEYIQMAGRAGRRGQDTLGLVYIIATSDIPSRDEFKEIISGRPSSITSRFRLTYGMILNLLGSSSEEESYKIESLIKASFSEFIQNTNSQGIRDKISLLQKELDEIQTTELSCVKCSSDINKYFENFRKYIVSFEVLILLTLINKSQLNFFYSEGRIIFINVGDNFDCRSAIILEGPRINFSQKMPKLSEIFIKVIFRVDRKDKKIEDLISPIEHANTIISEPYDLNYKNVFIVDVPLSRIILFTKKCIKINVRNIKSCLFPKHPNLLVLSHCSDGYNIKNSIDDISSNLMKNDIFKLPNLEIKSKITATEKECDLMNSEYIKAKFALSRNYHCLDCSQFKEHSEIITLKNKLQDEIKIHHKKLSDFNLMLMPDYYKRVQVLKDLAIVDEFNNLTFKGKVAIKFCNNLEIVLIQILFNTKLSTFSPQHLSCFLSCFCEQGLTMKEGEIKPLKYGLQNIWDNICITLDHIDKVESKHELCTSERPVHPFLMEAVYEWCQGCSFEDFVKTAGLPEGTLVRYILRLDEICRELERAAEHIGNLDLIECTKKARQMFKRDIINTSSLYLSENV